jgi:hypothetical protein
MSQIIAREDDGEAILLVALTLMEARFGHGWLNAWAVHRLACALFPPVFGHGRIPRFDPADGPWRASPRLEYDLHASLAFLPLETLALVARKPLPGPSAGVRLALSAQVPGYALSPKARNILERSAALMAEPALQSRAGAIAVLGGGGA